MERRFRLRPTLTGVSRRIAGPPDAPQGSCRLVNVLIGRADHICASAVLASRPVTDNSAQLESTRAKLRHLLSLRSAALIIQTKTKTTLIITDFTINAIEHYMHDLYYLTEF